MPKLRIEAGKKFCNLLFFEATSLDINDIEGSHRNYISQLNLRLSLYKIPYNNIKIYLDKTEIFKEPYPERSDLTIYREPISIPEPFEIPGPSCGIHGHYQPSDYLNLSNNTSDRFLTIKKLHKKMYPEFAKEFSRNDIFVCLNEIYQTNKNMFIEFDIPNSILKNIYTQPKSPLYLSEQSNLSKLLSNIHCFLSKLDCIWEKTPEIIGLLDLIPHAWFSKVYFSGSSHPKEWVVEQGDLVDAEIFVYDSGYDTDSIHFTRDIQGEIDFGEILYPNSPSIKSKISYWNKKFDDSQSKKIIINFPSKFKGKRGSYDLFKKEYTFDTSALIQISSIELDKYLRKSKKNIRRKIFEHALISYITVEDAIERARTIAFKETGEYSRGGEEDIFEAMAGNPPYITLKKIT